VPQVLAFLTSISPRVREHEKPFSTFEPAKKGAINPGRFDFFPVPTANALRFGLLSLCLNHIKQNGWHATHDESKCRSAKRHQRPLEHMEHIASHATPSLTYKECIARRADQTKFAG